jgi:hypothetical protein
MSIMVMDAILWFPANEETPCAEHISFLFTPSTIFEPDQQPVLLPVPGLGTAHLNVRLHDFEKEPVYDRAGFAASTTQGKPDESPLRKSDAVGNWGKPVHGVLLQVPGDVDNNDAPVASPEKEQLQELSALVVERGLPPVFDHELRDEDGDLTFGVVVFDLEDIIDERREDVATRGGKDYEFGDRCP